MMEERTTPLRKRMIDDMRIRRMGEKAQQAHIRAVKDFAAFLSRSPDTATSEELHSYQKHMTDAGVTPSTFNARIDGRRYDIAFEESLPAAFHLTLETARRVRSSIIRYWDSIPERPPSIARVFVVRSPTTGKTEARRSRCQLQDQKQLGPIDMLNRQLQGPAPNLHWV
jgi:hypothetical protein